MKFDKDKGPGRVFFFPNDRLTLDAVAYQPLENHVENVIYLMSQWRTDTETFDLALDKDKRTELANGAEYHDWGKTKKFKIVKADKSHWTYSYKGHRFLNPIEFEEKAKHDLKTLYHLTLERAHHDYSIKHIVQDAFTLKQRGAEHQNYPRDLFILEMCDQIEAEVAVIAIEEKEARNASFMEYEVSINKHQSNRSHKVFTLEPFPFEHEVNYHLCFKKDQLDQLQPDELWLETQGFESYEHIESIKITLKGKHDQQAKALSIEDFYIEDFYLKANNFTPNTLQRTVWQEWRSGSAGLIVKAPTGVGKTEACVYPPLCKGKRVILILPAKALVDDHQQRLSSVLTKLSSQGSDYRLLVDTGDTISLTEFINGTLNKPDNLYKEKQHLYRANVIITTLDKFIYRFFAYGGGRKSYTFPLRISDQSRTAFIFDEAHSYEGTAFTNFQSLITTLYDNQHNITLMTATLPTNYQRALQDPEDRGFPGRWDVIDFSSPDKQKQLIRKNQTFYGKKQLEYLPDQDTLDINAIEDFEQKQAMFDNHKQTRIERIVDLVKTQWSPQKRLIVTLDRVKDAVTVYKTLQNQLAIIPFHSQNPQDKSNIFLYHGRLDRHWRSNVYKTLKWHDSQGKPYILISTSAIEIGVDLDAHHLITEICNPDSLIQRMGRCNRQGLNSNARVSIVGSHIPDYLNAFGDNTQAYETYLKILQKNNKNIINSDFAQEIMNSFPKPVLTDPRAKTAYNMLYNYVYNFDLEYKNLHDLGFIATRSWDPTLEIRIPVGDNEMDHIQVPVSRLSRGTDDAYEILMEEYKMHQDKDKSWRGQWQEVERGGDLYKGTYRITLRNNTPLSTSYKRELGLVNLPKVFQRQRWKNDPPLKVRLNTWLYERTEDAGGTFFFASNDVDGKKEGKRLIFTYLADSVLET